MPDPRSAMKEYRFLEQKRVALGLTLDEEYRLAELRDLVGPELERLRRPGPGFDVNAAAARLRASLEGAVPGRRMAAPLAPSDSEDDADALLDAALGHANPAPLAPEASAGLSWAADVPDPTASYAVPEPRWELPGEPSDPGVQFTPGEQAWDPNTAHVDPGATPVDPYATYAAGEQAWDPNAYVDPAAGPVDPYATYPAGAQGWDPNAYVDPAAAPVDPDAAYAEGEQGLDPDAYVDPGAAPVDPASFTQGDQAWDPNAYVDPAVAPVDPDAAYADGEQGLDPDAYVDPGAPPVDPASFTQGDQVWDPNAYVDPAAPVDPDATYPAGEQAWDTDAYPAPPAAAESGLEPLALADDVELLDGSARGRAWAARDASPAGVASARLAELSLEDDPASEPTAPPAPGDAAGLPPEGWDTQASPPPAPLELALGEYDDPATAPPADGSPLPVDLAAEPTPELAAAGPALDLGEYDALAPAPPAADAGPEPFDLLEDSAATGSAPGNAPVLGEYDDTSGFEAPAGAFALGVGPDAPVEGGAHAAHGTDHDALAADADAEVSFGALFDEGDLSGDATAPVADAAEAAPGARDDAEAEGAFRQGFQLESGGSFEAAADAAVPEWATGGEPPGWDAGAPDPLAFEPPPAPADELDTPGDDPLLALEPPAALADELASPGDDPLLAFEPPAALADELAAPSDNPLLAFESPAASADELAPPSDDPLLALEPRPASADELAPPSDDPVLALEPPPASADELAAPSDDPLLALESPAAPADELAAPGDDPVLEADEAGAVLDVDEAGALELDAAGASLDLSEQAGLLSADQVPAEAFTPEPAAPGGELDAAPAEVAFPEPARTAHDVDASPAWLRSAPEPGALDDSRRAAAGLRPRGFEDLPAPVPAPEADPLPPLDLAFTPDLAAAPAHDLPAPGSDLFPPLDLGSIPDLGSADPAAPAELDSTPDLAALHALDTDVDLDDLPTLEGDLLEELPADELLPLDAPPESGSEPVPSTSAALARDGQVPGEHRVVVHTMEGLSHRGLLEHPDLSADTLLLQPLAGGAPAPVPTARVKAVFFMLAPGEPPPTPAGKRLHVTFQDGREVAGFSPDYSDRRAGFFMYPADPRTNTARIWIYQAAVKQVAVSPTGEGKRPAPGPSAGR